MCACRVGKWSRSQGDVGGQHQEFERNQTYQTIIFDVWWVWWFLYCFLHFSSQKFHLDPKFHIEPRHDWRWPGCSEHPRSNANPDVGWRWNPSHRCSPWAKICQKHQSCWLIWMWKLLSSANMWTAMEDNGRMWKMMNNHENVSSEDSWQDVRKYFKHPSKSLKLVPCCVMFFLTKASGCCQLRTSRWRPHSTPSAKNRLVGNPVFTTLGTSFAANPHGLVGTNILRHLKATQDWTWLNNIWSWHG